MKPKNIILITIGLVATTITTYFVVNYFSKNKNKKLTPEEKNTPIKIIKDKLQKLSISGKNIFIPAINKAFYSSDTASANKNKIETVIRPQFGKIINNVSKITNVPVPIIESFIFIESGGDPNAQSPYAVGLMQVSLATASDALIKEKGANRLSAAEAEIVKKTLGSRYDIIKEVKPNQKTIGKTFVTKNDLLNPEFNILVGTIIVKQLIDEFTQKNGNIRMDKVIAIYNAGRYSATSKKVIASTEPIDKIIKIVPTETQNYILKLLGERGILDTIV